MYRRKPGWILNLTAGFVLAGIQFAAQSFKFVTLDVPTSTFTLATGINSKGEVVGIYGDASFNEHGFLLGDGGSPVSLFVGIFTFM